VLFFVVLAMNRQVFVVRRKAKESKKQERKVGVVRTTFLQLLEE
jgi:hypothetical protein